MFWETKLVILNSLFENVFFASLFTNHPAGFAHDLICSFKLLCLWNYGLNPNVAPLSKVDVP
jgi:hypothetical protein